MAMSNKYLENIGANCNNCGNRGIKGKCNQKCLRFDNRPGWDPAPGVIVSEFDVSYKHQKGKGRQVISDERKAIV